MRVAELALQIELNTTLFTSVLGKYTMLWGEASEKTRTRDLEKILSRKDHKDASAFPDNFLLRLTPDILAGS